MSLLIQSLLASHGAVSSAIGAYWLARNQPSPKPGPDGSVVRLDGKALSVANAPKDMDFRFMLYAFAQLHGYEVATAKPKATVPGVAEVIGEMAGRE